MKSENQLLSDFIYENREELLKKTEFLFRQCFSYANNLGYSAEELFIDVFLKIQKKKFRLNGIEKPVTYFTKIVKNEIFDLWKKKKKEPVFIPINETIVESFPDSDFFVDVFEEPQDKIFAQMRSIFHGRIQTKLLCYFEQHGAPYKMVSIDWEFVAKQIGEDEKSCRQVFCDMKQKFFLKILRGEIANPIINKKFSYWDYLYDKISRKNLSQLDEWDELKKIIDEYGRPAIDYLDENISRGHAGFQMKFHLLSAEYFFKENGAWEKAILHANRACSLADNLLTKRERYITHIGKSVGILTYHPGRCIEAIQGIRMAVSNPLSLDISKLHQTVLDPAFIDLFFALVCAIRGNNLNEIELTKSMLNPFISSSSYKPSNEHAILAFDILKQNHASDRFLCVNETGIEYLERSMKDRMPSGILRCKYSRKMFSNRYDVTSPVLEKQRNWKIYY